MAATALLTLGTGAKLQGSEGATMYCAICAVGLQDSNARPGLVFGCDFLPCLPAWEGCSALLELLCCPLFLATK